MSHNRIDFINAATWINLHISIRPFQDMDGAVLWLYRKKNPTVKTNVYVELSWICETDLHVVIAHFERILALECDAYEVLQECNADYALQAPVEVKGYWGG